MNYQHAYHAGSFSDVIKHITLIALLRALSRKDTPFCYLDTHAGCGHYDLFSDAAKKNKEHEGGIEKIIRSSSPPPLVQEYIRCVQHTNDKLTQAKQTSLRYYPGSPVVARQFIRPHDRIVLCELQQQAYQALRRVFAGDKQAAVHHLDGFLGLKAFLPPRERRGLVLIDPPYEDPDEFSHIARSLPLALKHWETGIYAIWYPIKEKNPINRFYHRLKQNVSHPILVIELTLHPDLPHHLNGCGLAIINPPWQFEQTMATLLPWVWQSLSINQQGGYRVDFLVPFTK